MLPSPTIRPSIARRFMSFAVAALVALAWLWAITALALFPSLPPAARAAAVVTFLAATGVALWRVRPRVWRVPVVAGLVLCVVLAWMIQRPADDRAWVPGQERTPIAEFAGDIVTINQVRDATWHSTTEVDMRWDTRTYDLRTLETVDLVVQPFDDWRGLAHIFVTFGFADGRHLAISVEARRETGERYSPLRGAFRHYELLYVIGDERDLIGLRANIRRDPVYVFPTRATAAEARALFVSMLHRAGELATTPAFYNTATTTCATVLLRHVNHIRTHDVSALDWRIVFPGYADELAWDLALIDFTGTIEEARTRFLINERSAFDAALDSIAWSRKIRSIAE